MWRGHLDAITKRNNSYRKVSLYEKRNSQTLANGTIAKYDVLCKYRKKREAGVFFLKCILGVSRDM